MKNYSAFDIIGPKMIGPSSSHTAGAARIARIASKLVKSPIVKVDFLLHGSFAKTYKGHGTNRALMAGLLGFKEYDENLKESLKIADEKNIKYNFIPTDLGDVHPNTVKILIYQVNNQIVEIMGSSIGGGNIKITELNGMKLEFVGEYPTLIVKHIDGPGVITKITKVLADANINIAFMSVYRQDKGKEALMVLECDDNLSNNIIKTVEASSESVEEVYLIDSL
ncbi:MAG: L-serine ammonia-lyase, iron-sulfur-dependent subunit beta [Senegalia sp. (in: firmicutes)]|uniref:L-serine ammonia-lyase, iron-sulfur-dependent subunit beta n=1 Tax=Senegalia sp. (in: firmicutes) TaxID=1924098 RepID=UPI003F9E605F